MGIWKDTAVGSRPWSAGNKNFSAVRLSSTTRKLERTGKLQDYGQIMQEQISNEIMEPLPAQPTGEVVHYALHQVVVQHAEATRMRIVYYCS